MTIEIDVQGCRRSGTNWLKALLERNTTDEVDVHRGDPHTPHLPDPAEGRWTVVITKHPQAWICSVERYLSREDPALVHAATQRYWLRRTLAESWIEKNRRWLEASSPRGVSPRGMSGWPRVSIVRYEDLLDDLEALAEVIPEHVLKRPLEDVTERAQPSHEPGEVNLEGGVNRAYYTEKRWAAEFDADDLRFLRSSFSHPAGEHVLDALGYELEPPRGGDGS